MRNSSALRGAFAWTAATAAGSKPYYFNNMIRSAPKSRRRGYRSTRISWQTTSRKHDCPMNLFTRSVRQSGSRTDPILVHEQFLPFNRQKNSSFNDDSFHFGTMSYLTSLNVCGRNQGDAHNCGTILLTKFLFFTLECSVARLRRCRVFIVMDIVHHEARFFLIRRCPKVRGFTFVRTSMGLDLFSQST